MCCIHYCVGCAVSSRVLRFKIISGFFHTTLNDFEYVKAFLRAFDIFWIEFSKQLDFFFILKYMSFWLLTGTAYVSYNFLSSMQIWNLQVHEFLKIVWWTAKFWIRSLANTKNASRTKLKTSSQLQYVHKKWSLIKWVDDMHQVIGIFVRSCHEN